jgi:hypothetical protein
VHPAELDPSGKPCTAGAGIRVGKSHLLPRADFRTGSNGIEGGKSWCAGPLLMSSLAGSIGTSSKDGDREELRIIETG